MQLLAIAAGALLMGAAPTTLEGAGVTVKLDLDGYTQALGAGRLGKTYFRLGQYTGKGIVFSVLVDEVPEGATLAELQRHVLKDRNPRPEVTPVAEPAGFFFSYRQRDNTLGRELVQWHLHFNTLLGRKWVELHFSKTGREDLDEAAAKQAAVELIRSMRVQQGTEGLPGAKPVALDPGQVAAVERAVSKLDDPVAHARRRTGDAPKAGRGRLNAWIRFNLQRALDAKAKGSPEEASFYFFMALHALQDSALPAANDENGDPAVLAAGSTAKHDTPSTTVWRDRMAEDLRLCFERDQVPQGDLLLMYGIDTEAGPKDRPDQQPRPFSSGAAPTSPTK